MNDPRLFPLFNWTRSQLNTLPFTIHLIFCLTSAPSVSLSFVIVEGPRGSSTPRSCFFSRPPIHHPSKLCFPAIFFSLFLFAHLLTLFPSLLSFVRCSFVPSFVYSFP
ncbi:hypothetical protein BKA57DRAFT_454704 [Linnemannia elongata]|nr:hypothetical protein BKA57DRAFT_454704 [Linnemannia elongata]